MENPYTTLGVSKTATREEIKNAYRKLAKQSHPDLNPGSKEAEAKFKKVSGAYDILEDPAKRAKFDGGQIDESGQPRNPSAGAGYYESQRGGGRYSSSGDRGYDDIFVDLGDLFGNRARGRPGEAFEGGSRRGPSGAIPGEDRLYSLEVDFRDSILGGEREITLPDGRHLQIKIPAGIEAGQKLRMRGRGDPGIQGGDAGDAYVEIHVKASPYFRRNGMDLEIDIPVSLSEAVLGGEIRVPTATGAVLLKVPRGSNTGDKLRLRGKGVHGPGEIRGDEIISLNVMLPPAIDSELEEAIRKWSRTHSYSPREELEKAS